VRRSALLLLPCVAVCLAGCLTVRTTRPEPPDVSAEPAPADPPGEFLSAVGTAPEGAASDSAAAMADVEARDRLRDAIGEYTRGVIAAFLASEAQYPPPSEPLSAELSDILRTEVAAGLLRTAQPERVWQEPDGRVHVLYSLPIARVNAEIARRTRMVIPDVNPFGAGADRAMAALDDYLDASLAERLTAAARARPQPPEVLPDERTPRWLKTGTHADYPAERYYSAIGLGKDLPSAEASARSEVALRLNARVDRLLPALPDTPAGAALAAELQWLETGSLRFRADDLPGPRIAERWYDAVTDTHYTLAILGASHASDALSARAVTACEAAEGLLVSARNHRRAENFTASLRAYGEAVDAAQQAVVLQVRAAAVAPEPLGQIPAPQPPPPLQQACGELRSLLEAFRLEVVRGDLQWVQPGRPPAQEIALRVSAGDPAVPVPGLPVRMTDAQTGRVWAEAASDADGIAALRIRDALPPEPTRGALLAAIDVEAAALPAVARRFSLPPTEIAYAVRSRANVRLVLLLEEETAAGRGSAAEAAREMEEALTREGFRFVSGEDVRRHVHVAALRPDSDDAAIHEALAPLREWLGPYRCALVVLGEFRPQLAETSPVEEGRLVFARCPWRIRAVDTELPGDRPTVLDLSDTATAAYLGDEAEALRRARTEGRRQAVGAVVEALRERFGPP